jgi:hypothetical protein
VLSAPSFDDISDLVDSGLAALPVDIRPDRGLRRQAQWIPAILLSARRSLCTGDGEVMSNDEGMSNGGGMSSRVLMSMVILIAVIAYVLFGPSTALHPEFVTVGNAVFQLSPQTGTTERCLEQVCDVVLRP